MARILKRIAAADFILANTTPIELLPTPPTGYMYIPRVLHVELVPAATSPVVFGNGGVLQLLLGDVTAVDTLVASTCYGASTAQVQIVEIPHLFTATMAVATYVNAGIRLKVKTSNPTTGNGELKAVLYYSIWPTG